MGVIFSHSQTRRFNAIPTRPPTLTAAISADARPRFCRSRKRGSKKTQSIRPDSHAPLGIMGDYAHSSGEWMLSYRFMAMWMGDLRDGTQIISPDDVLQHFPLTPVRMNMQMHMFGVMFAPHNSITLMAITSYRDNFMEMQSGKTREHSHGNNNLPIRAHEMESAGLGDTRLSALIPLLRLQTVVVLLNAGLSIPTGSI